MRKTNSTLCIGCVERLVQIKLTIPTFAHAQAFVIAAVRKHPALNTVYESYRHMIHTGFLNIYRCYSSFIPIFHRPYELNNKLYKGE